MSNPISCVVTNVQRGSQRLTQDPNKRRLKHWRCELTALSSVYNLYFVACNDTIHVHQPTFPDQSLSDEPPVLHPPTTSPGLNGYIDDRSPHSINRLHVAFLGREEIVLVACDDGDVIGYRVQEIQRAVEKHNHSKMNQDSPVEDIDNLVRVFLHRNVGQSAWGLAVHREARIIAISANTRQVTVIAYALVGSPDENIDIETPDFPYPRRRDHTLTCTAGSNIPSVSFDNTGCDPAGKWMFSSSIDGKSLLWNLHTVNSKASPARAIELGYCDRHLHATQGAVCICPDSSMVPHAVWATMLVDPQSFRQSYDVREAWGSHPKQHSRRFQVLSSLKRRRDAASNATDEQTDSDASHAEEFALTASENEGEMEIHSDEDMPIADETEPEDSQPTTHQNTANDSLFVPDNATAPPDLPHPDTGSSSSENSDESSDEYTMLMGQPHRSTNNVKEYYCDIKTRDDFPVLNCQPPCLIITKSEIYLFQRPFGSVGDDASPIVTMRNPLYSAGWMSLPHDRLCYSAQIPELGIFIVASAGGRVAIFGLTQYKGEDGDVYGFRLDHTLPLNRQERELLIGGYSGTRLVGIAVGPVQGMLDGFEVMGHRRWRLIMMYDDHTVLSYELGKYREDADEIPGLADLVV